MKKKIMLIVGSTSWWKNLKYRKEAATKLKNLRKGWKLKKKSFINHQKIQLTQKFIKNIIYTNDL